MKKGLIAMFGFVVVALTACVLPEQEDPFERLPEETLEVIEGKLYPFSVSVSTRATHRLEREGKLVGYLASDLVQLAEFEGQEVTLEGVWRNEKMRQIFWVEGIKVQKLAEVEVDEDAPQRFSTKKFTMLVPANWEYSLAPNGVAYFLNKEDPARRVFLTFSVEDYSSEESNLEANIAMNGFKGIKTTGTDDSGKEREVISLYSNIDPKKYVFTTTYYFDDFETKKAVFDLLQSFVEGEDAVQNVIIEEQKAKAAEEAERLALLEAEERAAQAAETAETQTESGDEESAVNKAKGLLSGLFADESTEVESVVKAPETAEAASEVEAVQPETSVVVANSDYTNLIDNRAYIYESNTHDFTLKVPYGFWYRSFGAFDGSQTAVGVANNPVNSSADVKMWVKVIGKEQPAEGTTELITGNGVTLIKKRDDATVFEFTGPLEFRDALWSMADNLTP